MVSLYVIAIVAMLFGFMYASQPTQIGHVPPQIEYVTVVPKSVIGFPPPLPERKP